LASAQNVEGDSVTGDAIRFTQSTNEQIQKKGGKREWRRAYAKNQPLHLHQIHLIGGRAQRNPGDPGKTDLGEGKGAAKTIR